LRDELTTTPEPNKSLTFRLKPTLLRFVKEAADEQNRSVPNYVETVLLAEKKRHEAQLAQQVQENGPEPA